MTEIKTTGLKGLYNRINLFANVIREDVIDVTAFIDQPLSGDKLASNRVMLVSRTEKLINTGMDQSKLEFLNSLYVNFGRISSKEELEIIKQQYHPEFNIGTNKIGEGYRNTANRVLLTARAEHHIKTRRDLMPYEYIEMLTNNMAIKGN